MPSNVNNCDLIIIDTSVLLNLYDFSYQTLLDVLSILEIRKDKIWLPNQVLKEFKKNEYKKEKVFGHYLAIRTDLNTQCENFKKKFKNSLKIYRRKRFPALQNLEKQLDINIANLLGEIKNYKKITLSEEQEYKRFHEEEGVSKFIETLVQAQNIGNPYSIEELLKIYVEGEKRYKYKLPPGYMDDKIHNEKGKEAPEKFGDLLVWKQILDKVKNNTLNILFISNDKKEDWINNNTLREELLLEFKQHSPNSSLEYLTLENFLEEVDDMLSHFKTKVEVNPNNFITSLYNSDTTFKSNLNIFFQDVIDNDLNTFLQNETSIKIDNFNAEYNNDSISFDTYSIDFESQSIFLEAEIALNIDGIINNFENFSCVGNFFIEFIIEVNEENTNYSDIEISFISFHADNIKFGGKDVCPICNTKEGIYEHENGEYICEDCSPSLFCCPECGRHFNNSDSNIAGGICRDCFSEKD